MAVYDQIANEYKKSRELPYTIYVESYTYLQLLGDVSGKSILELACGGGENARILRNKGAIRVVGMDISEKMLDLAKQAETREPLGVEYQVQDVLTLGKHDEFDLVAAAYLLNYARTKEELLTMCRAIYVNLKVGGRFVGLITGFEIYPGKWEKYGLVKRYSGSRHDGTPIKITLFGEDWQVSFEAYYLSRNTYEWAFQQAGFKSLRWYNPQVSPAGIEKWGAEFWQAAMDYPPFVAIEGVK
ncbi:MAG: SAM-dependent methyltransferase [Thiotrichaceae bacterium IS1]|nr:MAG: SAM-dependent methyltransferase [Thiotrichaceae bacterium IS1]